jgi:sigma-B regulation protein RsbU (phosphoserine phosphatase)
MDSRRELSLLEEIARLRQEVVRLNRANTALDAQRQLLESFVVSARSPTNGETHLLRSFLGDMLNLSNHMTAAERGSILLVNSHGQIEDAILTNPRLVHISPSKLFTETLDRGVGGWVYAHHQPVMITDTRADERWIQWPDDREEIRSVLSVPIRKDELVCGVLTLLHTEPEHFTLETLQLMQATADQISVVLENAQLYGRLHLHSQSLDAEMDKGRQIQVNFLPAQIPHWDGWEVASRFQPAYQMAGDFYDIFELSGAHMGIIIADVCDKGVGAALFMGLFRSLMRIFSGQTVLPGLMLQTVESSDIESVAQPVIAPQSDRCDLTPLRAIRLTNDYVAINHGDLGMFATLFFGVLNPQTGQLDYVNGGHEPLIVVDRDGQVKAELKATGPALGVLRGAKFKIGHAQLAPGDVLLGYTDGVTEARSADGQFFTKARLLDILQVGIASADHLLQQIMAEVLDFARLTQKLDDITLIAVRRKEL